MMTAVGVEALAVWVWRPTALIQRYMAILQHFPWCWSEVLHSLHGDLCAAATRGTV